MCRVMGPKERLGFMKTSELEQSQMRVPQRAGQREGGGDEGKAIWQRAWPVHRHRAGGGQLWAESGQ